MDTEKLVIGKTIKIPAMRRGLVKYPKETVLVNQAALEQLAKTSYGIPVVIEHPGIQINPETIKSIPVHGRVADMHYDEKTDEWSVHFVIDTQEAVDKLNNGWGVSTAWYGDKYGNSGTYNAIPYDRELIEGHYEHLAIVEDPRYEMAKGPIFYNSKKDLISEIKKDTINDNSQKSGGSKMLFKLFRMVREEIKTNENEQFMLNIAGNEVPLANVLEEMKTMEAKKNEEEKKKSEQKAKTLNGEDLVEHNGEKISVNDLVKRYNELKKGEGEADSKKNEETEEEKKEKEAEAKKNAEAEEKKKKEEEAKENALKEAEKKRFEELKNTHDNASNDVNAEEFVTQAERVKAGSERYGSKT
jgi:hypothetical protein